MFATALAVSILIADTSVEQLAVPDAAEMKANSVVSNVKPMHSVLVSVLSAISVYVKSWKLPVSA